MLRNLSRARSRPKKRRNAANTDGSQPSQEVLRKQVTNALLKPRKSFNFGNRSGKARWKGSMVLYVDVCCRCRHPDLSCVRLQLPLPPRSHCVRFQSDRLLLHAQVGVDLDFTIGPPCDIAPGLETFEVTGPQTAVRFVKAQTESAGELRRRVERSRNSFRNSFRSAPIQDEYTTGFLSPRTPITLPDHAKLAAGVPLEVRGPKNARAGLQQQHH
jgi:hypothetical protein